jgi:methylated-DNA-protein-cysteine methyltransferase related protein
MAYDPERHGPRRIVGPGFHGRVQATVRRVPLGAVTTYGDVAAALGHRGVARQVGFALAALPSDPGVPWWRVVAAGGRISLGGDAAREQTQRLEAEGHSVHDGRVVDFVRRRHAFVTPPPA